MYRYHIIYQTNLLTRKVIIVRAWAWSKQCNSILMLDGNSNLWGGGGHYICRKENIVLGIEYTCLSTSVLLRQTIIPTWKLNYDNSVPHGHPRNQKKKGGKMGGGGGKKLTIKIIIVSHTMWHKQYCFHNVTLILGVHV